MKLRIKLPLYLSAVAVVPLIMLSFLSGKVVADSSIEYYKNTLSGVTESVYRNIAEYYSEHMSSLLYVSKNENVKILLENQGNEEFDRGFYTHNTSDFINNFSEGNNRIKHIYILDRNSTVVLSSDRTVKPGQTLYSSAANEAISSSFISTNLETDSSGHKNIEIACTVFNGNDEPIGAVLEVVNLDYIDSYIRNLNILDKSNIYIFNGNELVLSYHSKIDYGRDILFKASPDNITKKLNMLSGTNMGCFEYDAYKNTMLAAFRRVDSTDLTVVTATSKKDAASISKNVSLVIFICSFVVMGAILFLGILITYRLISPIFDIIYKIKLISAGDLTQRCNFKCKSEFKELADSIDIMAENLEANNIDLTKCAMFDVLTGLANRRAIYGIMDELFLQSTNQAVILFDLDGFKDINDSFGHDYGDDALCEVAKILKAVESDTVFTARLGGDEFLVFISSFDDRKSVEGLAEEILEAIIKIEYVFEIPVNLSASIGIAFLEDDDNRSSLVKKADNAMYQVKRAGKNAYHVFSDYDNIDNYWYTV